MKIPVALKLDFKIDEKGIVRIFDIGDGLGAQTDGFEDIPLTATLLHDLCDANKSAIATVFGELPEDAMHPKNLHIPIIQRKVPAERSWIDISDLSESESCSWLSYSQARRIQSYVAHFWGKKLDAVTTSPIGLLGVEMQKLLWYTLMQKDMSAEYRDNILYWCNDDPGVELEFGTIDMTHGVFIKIGDRSTGGGDGVYYAKNAAEVTEILRELHETYRFSDDRYKKHIYVIEPAYQTIKSYESEQYNVTGRAFVTLILDTETRALQVKIAGAKWMFPFEPLQEDKTEAQMLCNLSHCLGMLPLSPEELSTLSQQIVGIYGHVFTASIEHDDLLEYCKAFPIVGALQTVLRPNASYKLMLETSKLESSDKHSHQERCLMSIIHGFVSKHYLPADLSALLASEDQAPGYFYTATLTKKFLIEKICILSFLERYAKMVKASGGPYIQLPQVAFLLQNESLMSSKLDSFIKQFLHSKDTAYDLTDMNEALRQAAYVCDIEVLKLLIGTHRASVDEPSPETQETALDLALRSEGEMGIKESCIQLLKQNGAKCMPPQEEERSMMCNP